MQPSLAQFRWIRHRANPVLPPLATAAWENRRCMNPFALRHDGEYRLYYSGGDADGYQRLCLATAAADAPDQWRRHGVILDHGPSGAFDARWCVLPCVHRINDRWHLYYTGNDGSGQGLQSFPGIGLAISTDGIHFER